MNAREELRSVFTEAPSLAVLVSVCVCVFVVLGYLTVCFCFSSVNSLCCKIVVSNCSDVYQGALHSAPNTCVLFVSQSSTLFFPMVIESFGRTSFTIRIA